MGWLLELLALITWFPKNPASKHWQAEIDAFYKSLDRYNSGKGNKNNFTQHIIVDTLMDAIRTREEQEYLLIGVESHGVSLPESPDWSELKKGIDVFAKRIMSAE